MSLEIVLSFDSLSRVDGSARFGFGLYPQFLTSVSGPIEVRLATEQPSQSTIEVHVRPLSNVPGTESKKAAVILKEVIQREVIMEANPRTLVQFVVQALVPMSSMKITNDMLAAMINSCTLSLLHAVAVPMRGVICAVSVGWNETSGYVVQPVETILSRMDAGGCFAFLFSDSEESYISSCVWTNWRSLRTDPNASIGETDLGGALDTARDAAREIWEQMRLLVEGKEIPQSKKSSGVHERIDAEGEDDDAKMEI